MSKLAFISQEKCNVFCRSKSNGNIAAAIRRAKKEHIKVDPKGCPDEDSDIAIYGNESQLHLYFSRREVPGDETSKTIAGAYNYFKKIKTDSKSNLDFVLAHISKCDMSIGIKAEPAFSANDGLDNILLALIKYTDGLLFTGEGLVNKNGDFVLDIYGNYTVKMRANPALNRN